MKNFQNKAKIIKVSKVIHSILFVALVLWVIDFIVELTRISWRAWPVSTSHFMQGSIIIKVICHFIAFVCLFRFFGRLKNGYLFDGQAISQLASAGKWLLAQWLFEVLFGTYGSLVFGIGIISLMNLDSLLAGLTLVCGAWLLKEAQELQEEQELTV